MLDNPERTTAIEDLVNVTLDDIASAVRDGLGFDIPILQDSVVMAELRASDYMSTDEKNELYHRLHDPELTPEQRQQIITLRIVMGKIASSAHLRVEFERIERNFNQTFQPTLFQHVA